MYDAISMKSPEKANLWSPEADHWLPGAEGCCENKLQIDVSVLFRVWGNILKLDCGIGCTTP